MNTTGTQEATMETTMTDVRPLAQETDTAIAAIWTRAMPHLEEANQAAASAAKWRKAGTPSAVEYADDLAQRAQDAQAEADTIIAETFPLEATWKAHRWSRFFLVTSSEGHVHSSRQCSTTNPRTTYAWLPELSGASEDEAVERFGETMCTVCFPSAPVHPAWMRSVQEREAAEAAKASSECPGSRTYDHDASGLNYYQPRAVCNHCHRVVSATSTGKLRAHKRAS